MQNLPKAEVLEVEQYPDHVIQQEFESMEQLLSGAWLRSNTPLNILPQKSVVSSKNFRPEIKIFISLARFKKSEIYKVYFQSGRKLIHDLQFVRS